MPRLFIEIQSNIYLRKTNKMNKYCSACGTELVVTDTATYCPFCTFTKKKTMKTFFIHWKNGLEERLRGTSITNALVIARYDATTLNTLDYYTVNNDPTKMQILMPELIKKKQKRTQVHIIVYKDFSGYKQLVEGFNVKNIAEEEKNRYTKNNAPTAPLFSSYRVETITCWICDETE